MKRRFRLIAAVTAVFFVAAMVLVPATDSTAQIGAILKGAVVVTLVNQFGDQINDGINSALGQKGASTDLTTKVVPIFSAGQGRYLGAAQVAGPPGSIEKVQGVGQFEINITGRQFRTTVFVPVSSISTSKLHRVDDVGVSAIIDMKI